jgi:hypothetical protein
MLKISFNILITQQPIASRGIDSHGPGEGASRANLCNGLHTDGKILPKSIIKAERDLEIKLCSMQVIEK